MDSFVSFSNFKIKDKSFNTRLVVDSLKLESIISIYEKEILNGLVDTYEDNKIILFLNLKEDKKLDLENQLANHAICVETV